MNSSELCNRPLLPRDNPFLAAVIRGVLEGFNVPSGGTALLDSSLSDMIFVYEDHSPVRTAWMAKQPDVR